MMEQVPHIDGRKRVPRTTEQRIWNAVQQESQVHEPGIKGLDHMAGAMSPDTMGEFANDLIERAHTGINRSIKRGYL